MIAEYLEIKDSNLKIEDRMQINSLLDDLLTADGEFFNRETAVILFKLTPKTDKVNKLQVKVIDERKGDDISGDTGNGNTQFNTEGENKNINIGVPTPVRAGHFKLIFNLKTNTLTFWKFTDDETWGNEKCEFYLKYNKDYKPIGLFVRDDKSYSINIWPFKIGFEFILTEKILYKKPA